MSKYIHQHGIFGSSYKQEYRQHDQCQRWQRQYSKGVPQSRKKGYDAKTPEEDIHEQPSGQAVKSPLPHRWAEDGHKA